MTCLLYIWTKRKEIGGAVSDTGLDEVGED